MRKVDVFGRKLNQTRPFYLIILVFAIVLPGYFLINNYITTKIRDLDAERRVLQDELSQLYNQSQDELLLEIDEMTPYLPSEYLPNAIMGELNDVKNLSGLTLASSYDVALYDDVVSPFSVVLPSTLKVVKITISMTIDDASKMLDYSNFLIGLDTIYYIDALNVTYFSDNQAMVVITIYTFYNDIVIS